MRRNSSCVASLLFTVKITCVRINYRKILDYWIFLSLEGKLLAVLGLCIYMKFYFVFLYLASSKKGIGNNKLFNRILLLRIAELSCFNNQCTCSLCIVTRAFGGYCNLELSVLESSDASCYSLKTKVRILTWRLGTCCLNRRENCI